MAQAESARHMNKRIATLETLEQIFDTLDHLFQRPQPPMQSAALFGPVFGEEEFLNSDRTPRSQSELAAFLTDGLYHDIRGRLEP